MPAGDYDVTLHFAELQYLPPPEKLAYNLDKTPAATAPNAGERSFLVRLNGQALPPSAPPPACGPSWP
ncbi:MAG: hypothetical protein WKG07_00880 [Hymenobacter sp.]